MPLLFLLLGVAATGVVGLFVVAALRPTAFHLERSTTIAASRADIFRILRDLRRYDEWSPYANLDPSQRSTFEGDTANVGGSFAWEGSNKVGAGKMTLARITPDEEVELVLEFFRPFPAVNKVLWTLADAGGGDTRMTWTMEGQNDTVFSRAFSLVMMERMVGKSFEDGLAKLKAVAERPAAA